MKTLNNLKIGARMIGGFMIIVLLLAGVAVLGYVNMKNINDGMGAMYLDRLVPIERLGQAEAAFYFLRGDVYKFILTPDERAALEQEINAQTAIVDENMKAYRVSDLAQEEKDELARFDLAWAAYQKTVTDVLAQTKAGNDKEVMTMLAQGNEFSNSRRAVEASLDKLTEINVKVADETNKQGDVTFARATQTIAVLSAIALILSIGIGIWLTRGITRPLGMVISQLRALASSGGDLTYRLPATARDEIGDLARAFNAFLESLGNIMRSISEGALKLASSTNQISASTNEMAAGAESQNQQAARTSSSMEEITAAFQEVSRNTSSTADAARAAVTRAQQGTTRVQNTLAELSQSNAAFQQLRKRSAEIGELVSLIANIASQTNILALNAAIEAAGAGAAGLRFDVVAEEIRKLAQRTTESTARITTTVNDIQKDIQTAAELMERSSVQAQEAEQSLVDIVEGIASVNDMVGVVATATEQQVKAAGQVAEALQLITQVTQQTAQAAQESARSSNDLAGLAQSLRETSGKFKV